MSRRSEQHTWTLLTNHGHVLMCIAEEPEIRIREIAARTGITERAAQRIIGELEDSGFLSHTRVGRRNRYQVDTMRKSLHPLERHLDVASLGSDAFEPTHSGGAR
jgi:DNA-binding MarR family transcriptional regulator